MRVDMAGWVKVVNQVDKTRLYPELLPQTIHTLSQLNSIAKAHCCPRWNDNLRRQRRVGRWRWRRGGGGCRRHRGEGRGGNGCKERGRGGNGSRSKGERNRGKRGRGLAGQRGIGG